MEVKEENKYEIFQARRITYRLTELPKVIDDYHTDTLKDLLNKTIIDERIVAMKISKEYLE